MFIRFFRDNNPSLFFLLPILTLTLWSFSFFHKEPLIAAHPSFLYNLLIIPIHNFPVINNLLAVLLIISGGLMMNMLANENELLNRLSFLPSLFYVVFMSHNEGLLSLHPLLISNIFIIVGLHQLMSSYRKTTAFGDVFNAGFLFALASLFYVPYILLFPMLIAGLIIFRPYIWREWFISLLGLITPYYIVLTLLFYKDELPLFYNDIISCFTQYEKPEFDYSFIYSMIVVLGGLIALLSTFDVLKTLTFGSLKNKKSLQILLWAIIFGAAAMFFSPEWQFPYFTVFIIPASAFSARYFMNMKKQLLGEIVLFAFILLIVINDISSFLKYH